MNRTATSLLTATLLTAAPLSLAAAPASAASACTAISSTTVATPAAVVLDALGSQMVAVTVAVSTGGCTLDSVEALVRSASKVRSPLHLRQSRVDGDVVYFTGSLPLAAADLSNADAGRWQVTSTAKASGAAIQSDSDSDSDSGDGDSADEGEDVGDVVAISSARVSVLAASSLSGDLTSAQLRKGRIAKGKVVRVSGTLSRANWDAASTGTYRKQRVDLQFRTTAGAYQKVRTLTTSKSGVIDARVKTIKDGCYRLVFRGDRTTAPSTSAGECLDVR